MIFTPEGRPALQDTRDTKREAWYDTACKMKRTKQDLLDIGYFAASVEINFEEVNP